MKKYRNILMKRLSKNNSGSGFLGFEKLLRFLVLILPLCLFFSYFPVIGLGASESMNFELSIPLIWLVMFDLVGGIYLLAKKELFSGVLSKWAWLLFPIWVTLSAIWSLNVTRGILTAGVLWLIYIAGFVVWKIRNIFDDEFRSKFWKWFFGSTLFVCGWCVLQCVLDLAGVPQEYSLMCDGCTYRMFGFPHPNGFAIEPQFMGNLLLAPAMICVWLVAKKQTGKNLELEPSRGRVFDNRSGGAAPKFQFRTRSVTVVKNTSGSGFLCSKFLLVCFFAIIATLFLTFSRGAIYAFIVGLCFMSAFVLMATRKGERGKLVKRVLSVWGAVILSFLFTLNLQGIMAAMSPTNDTYVTGVTKVLNHLSLGIIDAREKNDNPRDGEIEADSENREKLPVEKPVENFEDNREESVFDGYVEESTETRLRLSKAALEIWSQNPTRMLIGVGLGGAGQALYDNDLSPAPKEIVQNEYISLLLETGLVGVSLFMLTIVLLSITAWRRKTVRVAVLSLLVAYGASICFFSGLPNALQIYLLPVVIMMLGF